MSSEWMKVMLEEISRKKSEAEQDQIEREQERRAERRSAEHEGQRPHRPLRVRPTLRRRPPEDDSAQG